MLSDELKNEVILWNEAQKRYSQQSKEHRQKRLVANGLEGIAAITMNAVISLEYKQASREYYKAKARYEAAFSTSTTSEFLAARSNVSVADRMQAIDLIESNPNLKAIADAVRARDAALKEAKPVARTENSSSENEEEKARAAGIEELPDEF